MNRNKGKIKREEKRMTFSIIKRGNKRNRKVEPSRMRKTRNNRGMLRNTNK